MTVRFRDRAPLPPEEVALGAEAAGSRGPQVARLLLCPTRNLHRHHGCGSRNPLPSACSMGWGALWEEHYGGGSVQADAKGTAAKVSTIFPGRDLAPLPHLSWATVGLASNTCLRESSTRLPHTPVPARHPHATHTPSTRHPPAIHTPPTCHPRAIHTSSTHHPYAIHVPSTHTPPTCHPPAIHTPSTRHPRAIHQPPTCHRTPPAHPSAHAGSHLPHTQRPHHRGEDAERPQRRLRSTPHKISTDQNLAEQTVRDAWHSGATTQEADAKNSSKRQLLKDVFGSLSLPKVLPWVSGCSEVRTVGSF